MWRSEQEVALNDLEAATREAADFYADDTDALRSGPLAQLFADLAARRDRYASRLAELIRRGGDLPAVPDTDRETLLRLGKRLRAALAPDAVAEILADRIAAEEALYGLIERAQAEVRRPELRALLDEFRRDCEQARDELGRLRRGT